VQMVSAEHGTALSKNSSETLDARRRNFSEVLGSTRRAPGSVHSEARCWMLQIRRDGFTVFFFTSVIKAVREVIARTTCTSAVCELRLRERSISLILASSRSIMLPRLGVRSVWRTDSTPNGRLSEINFVSHSMNVWHRRVLIYTQDLMPKG
jgi:hypothetical protein